MTNELKSYTLDIIEDPNNPDDLLLTLPDELLTTLGWKADDVIIWHVDGDKVSIRKKEPDGL